MKGWLDNIEKAQTGKIVQPETETARAKRIAKKVAGSSGIGLALDQFPGVETAYDLYNIADAYKQGDPMKIIPNVMGALLPGLSGKSFEAISDEYLPKTPKKEKEKFKAVSKGKRASIEEIKKAQESVDWSTGFKKLYDDAGEIGTDIKNTIDDTVSPLMGLKNGGWLDNYNDSEVSLPEGFVGEGIFNGPKFDNPAWGGQFQNGGKKKPITTREDFDPSVLSNIPGLTSLASGNQPGYNREEQYGPLGDLYRYYGGQPLEHDVLVESQNKPSTSKDKNAKYISLNHDREFVNEVLDNYERVSSGKLDKGIESKLNDNSWSVSGYSSAGKDAHKTKKQGSEHHSNAIGRYTLGKGKDKKGEYISYYDKFDQGTGDDLNPGEALGLTKPFEIYDRIYLKDVNRKYQMGGNLPGAVGNMYARTGSPSKGPRRNQTDVTDASAQNGKEMQYYQQGLDFQPKTISKNGSWLSKYDEGGIIKDDRGQWGKHKGEPTRINQSEPGSYIDMGPDPLTGEPLTQPLLGISDKGERKIMYPGEKHKYKKGTKYVDEYPKGKLAKNGLRQEQKGLQNLEDLTNFTNYNKPTNWLNKYN